MQVADLVELLPGEHSIHGFPEVIQGMLLRTNQQLVIRGHILIPGGGMQELLPVIAKSNLSILEDLKVSLNLSQRIRELNFRGVDAFNGVGDFLSLHGEEVVIYGGLRLIVHGAVLGRAAFTVLYLRVGDGLVVLELELAHFSQGEKLKLLIMTSFRRDEEIRLFFEAV